MKSRRDEGKPCFQLPAKIKGNSREAMFDICVYCPHYWSRAIIVIFLINGILTAMCTSLQTLDTRGRFIS